MSNKSFLKKLTAFDGSEYLLKAFGQAADPRPLRAPDSVDPDYVNPAKREQARKEIKEEIKEWYMAGAPKDREEKQSLQKKINEINLDHKYFTAQEIANITNEVYREATKNTTSPSTPGIDIDDKMIQEMIDKDRQISARKNLHPAIKAEVKEAWSYYLRSKGAVSNVTNMNKVINMVLTRYK